MSVLGGAGVVRGKKDEGMAMRVKHCLVPPVSLLIQGTFFFTIIFV